MEVTCDGKSVKHWNVRIVEHTVISQFYKKKVKHKIKSLVDHLLFCSHSASDDDFTILTRDKKKVFARTKREPVNHER